jgi:LPS O-antigen subunit length determinant protein (WzzB/FepE family)
MDSENDKKDKNDMDISDVIVILIRKKWWFIGTLIIVLVIGLTYVFLQPVNYLLKYQIELKEDYHNETLSELYPNFENDLNYLSLENVPVLLKSEEVLRSVKGLDKDLDYRKLRNEELLSINLREKTSIFDISLSNPDYALADNVNQTVISAFKDMIEERLEDTLNSVFASIEEDIAKIEEKNNEIENIEIAGIKSEIDKLYEELDRYIIDYNIELSDRLEENKNSENVSFYNVIIPPNDISNKISNLDSEIEVYENKVLENKETIIELENLYEKLQKDKYIITERIRVVSDSSYYEIESNRLRNIAIVIVASIILAVLMVFIVNAIENSRLKEKIRKK